MSRIFRCGTTYASIEVGQSLAYINVDGLEEHITRAWNVANVLRCVELLSKLTHLSGWHWVI